MPVQSFKNPHHPFHAFYNNPPKLAYSFIKKNFLKAAVGFGIVPKGHFGGKSNTLARSAHNLPEPVGPPGAGWAGRSGVCEI